ncbi:bifunctional 4-hydroxy-2-oxoglutarate aldolase/2-dehydro-3-deoxy-phosphogluconate aldolase [Kaistia terrae]|uniref:Bifunctional 4-hydroxy-2-oxoglutarate aldolase/2-dehydro-3-deoxy-phosphogluconate aldolase n=1 Tax=Kaistia terrae TaxID=537017 RepID=A0ABW0PW80_9HYPH|nr:bifunctional 4-hydroxy-2-oxoglutarate aldolase/2-dehydro-3-deoxy-phosphogluconate aldolase [Kaistia terrae]MCX5579246.1 bifunctional 4-hydroxy-2-oxoglutarate aldolase/2-dehydro-3-deoxy-phosphogluconate aldolase [Kaistia terrae]
MTPDILEPKLRQAAIMPIVQPRSVDFVLSLVAELAEGGAEAIEIVMRSDAALSAIEACRREFPELLVGAGTILTDAHYDAAVNAGAQFGISPGFLPSVCAHAKRGPITLVPGVQTASEVMAAQAAGFDLLKFYPSEPAGGTVVLADFANIFTTATFMPSGKIQLSHLAGYARLKNITSVGGSWMYAEGSTTSARDRMAASLAAMREGRR